MKNRMFIQNEEAFIFEDVSFKKKDIFIQKSIGFVSSYQNLILNFD